MRLWDVATRRQIGHPLTGHTARSSRWRSARTARPWPAAAATARCGCGTWPPAARSGSPLTGHTGAVTSVAFSPDGKTLASGSARGTVRLWDVATRQQIGNPLTGHTERGHLGGVQPGRQDPGQRQRRRHGAAVGRGHPPPDRQHFHRPYRRGSTSVAFSPDGKTLATAATTARCGCGTWPPAARSASPLTGHTGDGHLGGVQPGRQDPGQRRRRRHGAAVGCGHPPQIGDPLTGHTGLVDLGGVQPGRQDPGHRQQRRHGAAVGCGHPPPDRRPFHRPHRRRKLRGVQPGRQDLSPAPTCGCGMWLTSRTRCDICAPSPDGRSHALSGHGTRHRARRTKASAPEHRVSDLKIMHKGDSRSSYSSSVP